MDEAAAVQAGRHRLTLEADFFIGRTTLLDRLRKPWAPRSTHSGSKYVLPASSAQGIVSRGKGEEEMKNCMSCGADAPGDARECEQCGYQFSYVTGPTDSAARDASPERPISDRPDGAAPMMIGWLCLVISVLLFITSLNSYGWFLYQMAAGSFFSLFLFLWSVGYVVRAISFLPEKDRD
jgi:hypothetical protein